MNVYQEYIKKYDLGTYDQNKNYTGPFWLGRKLTKVLSQNPTINYLSYLHDNAYNMQIEKRSKIDKDYRDAIILMTRDKELADIMYLGIRKLGWVSWTRGSILKVLKRV